LDVNMPKMNGFDFLRSVNNLPMVIMTTAYGQYALDGFEMAVIDYLVKPFSLERFLRAVQKALEYHMLKQKSHAPTGPKNNYFYVKCDGKIEKVVYDNLLYIEALTNYVTLYTVNDKLIVYLTVKGILEKLPAEKFIQVHKSYIVNIDRNTKITIGQSFYDEVMERLLQGRFLKR
jgi:DNA-binding LytR/AlgR family response regulator